MGNSSSQPGDEVAQRSDAMAAERLRRPARRRRRQTHQVPFAERKHWTALPYRLLLSLSEAKPDVGDARPVQHMLWDGCARSVIVVVKADDEEAVPLSVRLR